MRTRVLSVLAILVILAFASCGLFRKKNRCNTCPSWGKNTTIISTSEQLAE